MSKVSEADVFLAALGLQPSSENKKKPDTEHQPGHDRGVYVYHDQDSQRVVGLSETMSPKLYQRIVPDDAAE